MQKIICMMVLLHQLIPRLAPSPGNTSISILLPLPEHIPHPTSPPPPHLCPPAPHHLPSALLPLHMQGLHHDIWPLAELHWIDITHLDVVVFSASACNSTASAAMVLAIACGVRHHVTAAIFLEVGWACSRWYHTSGMTTLVSCIH